MDFVMLVVGFVAGAIFGTVMMGILCANGDMEDEEEEEENREEQ